MPGCLGYLARLALLIFFFFLFSPGIFQEQTIVNIAFMKIKRYILSRKKEDLTTKQLSDNENNTPINRQKTISQVSV